MRSSAAIRHNTRELLCSVTVNAQAANAIHDRVNISNNAKLEERTTETLGVTICAEGEVDDFDNPTPGQQMSDRGRIVKCGRY
jgi:hypothetical protein